MAKLLTAWDKKRLAKRNEKWPDAATVIYDKRMESGFCTVPRTLAIVATMIKQLSKSDPSRVYIDLWTRQRDDGYVEAVDFEELAACAGLSGTRAVKSWKEKVDELQELGFIRLKEKGNQRYAFILLLHPHDVLQQIHYARPEAISPALWSYFENRIQDIGATLRVAASVLGEPAAPAEGAG